MRTNIYGFLGVLLGLVVLTSCNNDDDDDLRIADVPNVVVNTLEVKYPGTTLVDWEKELGYFVADFYKDGVETHVWIDADGKWRMTESDLGKVLSNLPETVLGAFQSSQYADWVVEDIDKYERTDRTFYVLEIEKRGQQDRKLFYGEDGTLLKDEVDKDNDDVTPDTVL